MRKFYVIDSKAQKRTDGFMQYTDIFELSRARAEISGAFTGSDLPDLMSMLDEEIGQADVRWHAQGTAGRNDLPGADLELCARIQTRCVRCGEPVVIEIDKTVPFLFVKNEKEANDIPIEEDGDYEIVVGSRKFDLAAWIEEELILSLPFFAQHEDCQPDEERLHTKQTGKTQERDNPFACLAALKTKK